MPAGGANGAVVGTFFATGSRLACAGAILDGWSTRCVLRIRIVIVRMIAISALDHGKAPGDNKVGRNERRGRGPAPAPLTIMGGKEGAGNQYPPPLFFFLPFGLGPEANKHRGACILVRLAQSNEQDGGEQAARENRAHTHREREGRHTPERGAARRGDEQGAKRVSGRGVRRGRQTCDRRGARAS